MTSSSVLFLLMGSIWYLSPSFCQYDKNVRIECALYEAMELALVEDKTNLIKLGKLFYPPTFIQTDTVEVVIHSCNLTVRNMTFSYRSNLENPGLRDCNGTCCGSGNNTCYCMGSDVLRFYISDNVNANSQHKLLNYINSQEVQIFMNSTDILSMLLFDQLTDSFSSRRVTNSVRISLHIHELTLDTDPSRTELIDALSLLLSWAKYYARSQGIITADRKDTDRMLIYYSESLNNGSNYSGLFTMCLLYSLSFIIAIVGIYCVPKFLQQSVTRIRQNNNSLSMKDFNELYWATVIVCGVINGVYIGVYLFLNNPPPYPVGVLMAAIFIIETPSVWIIIKDFKITDTVCRFSNRYVLRAVHTLAICHILWFLHRVGCNLLVAIFFIALAPPQTLAAISLIYFVILSTVMYVAYNLHSIGRIRCLKKESCKTVFNLFVAAIVYVLTIAFLIFLMLTFDTLSKNGLTSSGLGSVVLSLVAPTIVFIITLKLKQHLEQFLHPNVSSSEISSSETNLEEEEVEEKITPLVS